jgi:hypothetical protein
VVIGFLMGACAADLLAVLAFAAGVLLLLQR